MASFTPIGIEAVAKGLDSFSRGMSQMGKDMDRAGSKAGALGKAVSGMSSAVMKVGGLAVKGAAVGIAAFGAGLVVAAKKGIEMNAMLETATLQFTTLLGSADKAQKHVKELFDFAAKTPFETAPIMEASRMMLTFGGEALATKENLTLVGDAAAAANQPINEMAFWFGRAYSAINAGQPFGEAAMRLQEMGVLTADGRTKLEELQTAGADTDEVWGALTEEFGRFNGAMVLQSQSWSGLMSTFTDGVGIAAATAFEPLFGYFKTLLAGIVDFVSSEEFSTWVQGIATFIENDVLPVFNSIIDWAKDFLPKAIETAAQFWSEVLLPAIQGVYEWLTLTFLPWWNETAKPWLEEKMGQALAIAAQFWNGTLLPAIRDVKEWIELTFMPWWEQTAKPWLEEEWGKTLEIAGAAWTGLKDTIDTVKTFIIETFIPQGMTPLRQSLNPDLTDDVGNAVTALKGQPTSLFETLYDVQEPVDFLAQDVRDLGKAVENFWRFLSFNFNPELDTTKGKTVDLKDGFIDASDSIVVSLTDAFNDVTLILSRAQTDFWNLKINIGKRVDEITDKFESFKLHVEVQMNTIVMKWDLFKRKLEGDWKDAVDNFVDVVLGPFIDAGNSIVRAFDDVKSSLDNLKTWLEQNAEKVADWLRKIGLLAESPPKLAVGAHASAEAIGEAVSMFRELLDVLGKFKSLEDVFEFGEGFSAFGGGIAERYKERVTDPLEGRLKSIRERMKEVNEMLEDGNYETGYRLSLMYELESLQRQQAEASKEFEESQSHLLPLLEKQADLAYLKQQMDFLNFLKEYDIDPKDILGGLKLGLGADMEGLLDAMSNAMRLIIERAEDELEIGSPSKVFAGIGAQIMSGLSAGIAGMVDIPMKAIRGVMGGLTSQAMQPALVSAGPVMPSRTVNVSVSGNNINNGMDWATFQAAVKTTVREAIEYG